MENSPLSRTGFRPNPSAMSGDDALRNCKPGSETLERAFRVETLKHPKQSFGVPRIEASAVVTHVIDEV